MTGEYEVMYALRGAPTSDLDALRDHLSELGHSVVIVGDQAVAQVHVHLAEAGCGGRSCPATGELSQVRITAVPSHPAAGQPAVGRRVSWPSWPARDLRRL